MNCIKRQSIKTKSKSMKNNFFWTSLFLFGLSIAVYAQPSDTPLNQQKIDGVAAVVGGEVILDSDIQRDFVRALAQGFKVERNCEFFENILIEKLLVSRAKEDTLINITNDQVDSQVDMTDQRFLTQSSEEEI